MSERQTAETAEAIRLHEDAAREKNWKRWGPYLSERQWGTVREDYSEWGNCWEYFSHDQARSRAYRWGEDGLLGICDRQARLCFALALWNGHDPILKERLFGLTGPEGNHGEDCKENYYYLEATPTSSYLKALYKYPKNGYPYAQLVEENRRRGKLDPEFELADSGVFDDGNYYDVTAEYAKVDDDDILIRITVENRSSEEALVHLLPTLWFRNTWSWGRSSEGYGDKTLLPCAGQPRHRARQRCLGRDGARVRSRLRGRRVTLYRERDQLAGALRNGIREPLLEGRLSSLPGEWRTSGRKPRTNGHQSRRALPTSHPGARQSRCPRAAQGRQSRAQLRRGLRRGVPPNASPRATSFTRK